MNRTLDEIQRLALIPNALKSHLHSFDIIYCDEQKIRFLTSQLDTAGITFIAAKDPYGVYTVTVLNNIKHMLSWGHDAKADLLNSWVTAHRNLVYQYEAGILKFDTVDAFINHLQIIDKGGYKREAKLFIAHTEPEMLENYNESFKKLVRELKGEDDIPEYNNGAFFGS